MKLIYNLPQTFTKRLRAIRGRFSMSFAFLLATFTPLFMLLRMYASTELYDHSGEKPPGLEGIALRPYEDSVDTERVEGWLTIGKSIKITAKKPPQ